MSRAHRSVVFSIVTALAGLPYAGGAMAGDASGAPQDAPPAPAQAEPAAPPAPAAEQPKKERFERRQERARGEDPDRAQQMEQRQQERQDRLRERQEAERARAEREQQKQEAERARAEREQQKQEAERARAEREQQKQEAERARAEREQQKQEAERARAEREQQKQDAERARAEREQQKQEAKRARAEREQQKQEAERAGAEREQRQQDAERAKAERQVEERARQEQPQNQTSPDRQVRDRNTAPGEARDDNRRRFERRENPSVATPPPARNVGPAIAPPPTREVERAGPRDDNRRRSERGNGAPRDVPPPSTYPAGGSQPAVVPPPTREVERAGPRDDNRRRFDRRDGAPKGEPPPSPYPAGGSGPTVAPPPVREEARRAVGRDVIRESYTSAPPQQRSFDDLKRNRRERTISQGNLRVIEEPDRRVIVKQDNRTFIRHDESERFRRIAPDARTIKRADGTSTTFMTRSGGVRIYDVTDRTGRLLQRYRRYPNGREVVLIDNRRHYRRDKSRTRDVLIGAGIGLVLGSAIALAAPDVRIPRDRYIVDYSRASDDDLYEALTAPPIERLDRGYSLDEIRYARHLRDRMRRIDLDTVTFDFGSWEVGPDQGRALDRLADGINRVLQRNPDEIFMIEGHTDAVGSEEDNLTLSDRRAQSVAEILTTEYGVAPENLVTQGYGEEQLKIPTGGPERLNRRITVRRIGPLLTGQFEEERYSGARPIDDRPGDPGRGYEDLDDGPPGDGLPDVVSPDDGRTYDYDRDRYEDGR